MNYDTLKWCIHGQHMQPREEFRTLPGTKPRSKTVCGKCYAIILDARKREPKRVAG